MSSDEHEASSTVTHLAAGAAPRARERAFVVVVTAGPDKGTRLTIDGQAVGRVLVGQGPSADLRLSDREVSRRHASLDHAGGALRLRDLESTNGTFVDRVRVVEALLTGGELIRVGTTVLRVDEGPDVEPTDETAAPIVDAFGRVVGASREMRRLHPLFARVAQSAVPVILEGETGTGKEVLAEALHEEGPRARGPFVIFDCTAVPSSLVESELFGHERGAFTGASSARRGVFEQAHGGTLFIDEIGDLELSLQPKLLRAIERSQVRRVGGDAWLQVDVRVVAATRRDLDREVERGRFRDDLYHRLAVARIELPPLRERHGDVTVLARHFWAQLGGDPRALPAALLAQWEAEPWPGNVRALRNAVARRLALGELDLGKPPARASTTKSGAGAGNDLVAEVLAAGLPFPRARDRVLERFRDRYVAHVLAQHGGNIAEAAASSGIGRRYFEKLRAAKGRGA